MNIKEKIIIKEKQDISNLLEKNETDHNINTIVVTLSWTSGIDFDLSVLAFCEKTGKYAFVYYGDKSYYSNGKIYIKLDKDSGRWDTKGNNSETINMTLTDEFTHYIFIVWDYTTIRSGKKARFSESDLSITYTINNQTQLATKLNSIKDGNVICFSSIYKKQNNYTIENISSVHDIKINIGSSITKEMISLGISIILKDLECKIVENILNYKKINKNYSRENIYLFLKKEYPKLSIDILDILTNLIINEYFKENMPTIEKILNNEKPKSWFKKLFRIS